MRGLVSTAVAFSVLVLLAAPSSAAVITVDCSGGADYTSIAEAIAAAGTQDTILVAPCVYDEQVETDGKCLTIIGSGAGETIWQWFGDGPALSIGDLPNPWRFTVKDMAFVDGGSGYPQVIRWSAERLVLESCTVAGGLRGSGPKTHTSIVDCSIDAIQASAGMRSSEIASSTIGQANFYGADYYWHDVSIQQSEIGELSGWSGDMTLDACVVDLLDEPGVCEATNSEFGAVLMRGGKLTLRHCTVNDGITVWGWSTTADYYFGRLSLRYCLVSGGIDYDVELDMSAWAGLDLAHNTIVGDASFTVWGMPGGYHTIWPNRLRGNIVTGATSLVGEWGTQAYLTLTHNDFVGGVAFPDVVADSVFANIAVPPLFCGAGLADYDLQECSPCVGAAHDGTDIGAFGVGCPCETLVEEKTWGAIKALYR